MLLLSKHGGNAFVLMFLQLFFAALFFISSVSCDGGGNEVYYRVIDEPVESFKTIYYCKLTNQETNTHGCLEDKNAKFNALKKFELNEVHFDREEARKVDLAVHKDGEVSKYSKIPFDKLGYPIFSRVSKATTGYTSLIIRMAYGLPESNNPDLPMFSSVHVFDWAERCKAYLAVTKHGKTNGDYTQVVAYINQKYNEYGWLFIKHKEHVCMYYAKLEDLYDGYWDGDDLIPVRDTKRVEDTNGKLHFKMLANYPTKNYLKRFFAFDPLFGCFVSMYWDGDRNHDPEAHFFKFDESNPLATPELVYAYALPDFNKDLLQSVLEEHFLPAVQHVFQSYGGQIFVFGRHPVTCNGFIGHYRDPYVYYTKDLPSTTEGTMDPRYNDVCYYNNRWIPTNRNEVPLMYVKENWITFTIPAYKMNGPIPLPTPPPSTSTSSSTTTSTTTTSTTTTTEKPTSSSSEAPSSSSPVPTTSSTPEPFSSTEVSSTPDPVTQTLEPTSSSSTPSPVSNSTEDYLFSNASSTTSSSSPLPSNSTNEKSLPYVAETTTSDGSKSLCSSYVDDCLWCLILLIIIDVLLLVVFIILIIFERRGANQRKYEMSQETEAATTAAGTEMSKHSNVKSQKKSKTKKSQSETVGNTTAAGDETTIKKVDTIDDGTKGTKFFTVNSDFEAPSKKKAIGKK